MAGAEVAEAEGAEVAEAEVAAGEEVAEVVGGRLNGTAIKEATPRPGVGATGELTFTSTTAYGAMRVSAKGV